MCHTSLNLQQSKTITLLLFELFQSPFLLKWLCCRCPMKTIRPWCVWLRTWLKEHFNHLNGKRATQSRETTWKVTSKSLEGCFQPSVSWRSQTQSGTIMMFIPVRHSTTTSYMWKRSQKVQCHYSKYSLVYITFIEYFNSLIIDFFSTYTNCLLQCQICLINKRKFVNFRLK